METCAHEFIPFSIGFGMPYINKCCIRCGKSMDEIMRNGFMMEAIDDLMQEPQHLAFLGHELNSK